MMNNVHKPILSEIQDLKSFVHNFQVSVVMPFYKKISEFKKALNINAPFFSRNGVEVVISMDDNSEERDVIEVMMSYPFINWKLVVNDTTHSWRNPVKAINVGIRHATKKYILVCSPESIFYTDAIYIMRKHIEYYPNHFAIGSVAFATAQDIKKKNMKFNMPYGSIFAPKEVFELVNGYDETLVSWGGDDDNIRARLEMAGIKKLFLPDVKLVHEEKSDLDVNNRMVRRLSNLEYADILYPRSPVANIDKSWGLNYNRIAYNWRHNTYSEQLLKMYLEVFVKYDYKNKSCNVRCKRILLVQVYNGEKWLNNFIANVEPYFDGIIFLDDGSSDNTYEYIQSSKLFLKVTKQRECFNDIENRNIMLRIASFFDAEWFCFMDVDELFDVRFIDFDKATEDPTVDTLIFKHTHLWNNIDTYNTEYPFSKKGILERHRMFRNIGASQILTDKIKLHFPSVPYCGNVLKSKILYHHLGNISKDDRVQRYLMYKIEDVANDQKSYEHLLNHAPKLLNIMDIKMENEDFVNIYDYLLIR